jgi:hypothetical protein
MSEATRFIKKPIPITAHRFYPPEHPEYRGTHRVGCGVGMADIGTITEMRPDANNVYYSIKTISGWARIEPGDWIIIGNPHGSVTRDIYPCKNDVFMATYEPFNDTTGGAS